MQVAERSRRQARRALVTGASAGIGREFVVQLAQNGFRVTAVARREAELDALLAQIPGDGHDYIVADLASAEDLERVSTNMANERCHLLVNNAGYSVFDPFYSSSLARQQDILALNCGAVLALAHAFLNQAEEGDALINLSSIVSALPTPAQPVYSASKAFVASFSECLWEEQRKRGIYVMALCPGITRTEFISTASGGESDGQSLPAALSQDAVDVVAEALEALQRRRQPIVVTGRVNRLMFGLMPRLLSRFRLLKTLAAMGDPEKRL